MAVAGDLPVSGRCTDLTGQGPGIHFEDPDFVGSDCFN
jgi:hypothetical protein